MHRLFRARLLASVLAVSAVPFVVTAVPAQAQMRSHIGFDRFHDQLAQYGDWVYSDRWGLVWQPADVPDDFRPYYSDGHWAYTRAYGWIWASDYDWGDIAFHYGRWVDDPYDGWMWIPGYSWSPGWVIWRSNGRSVGWMAMPPDDQFLRGRGDYSIGISFGGISVNWNDTSGDYGYSRWYGHDYDERRFAANWTFVDTGHMADRDYRQVAYAPDRAIISIRQTTNITNYTVVNNYVVNRSIDVHAVEQASGHPVPTVADATVIKHPDLVMTVDASQKVHAQEFARAPHGTGVANSAPPPPPAVVDKLSEHVAAHHAGAVDNKAAAAPTHLFTKTTITAPAATTQFHGKPQTGPTGANPAVGTPLAPTGPQGPHTGPTGGPLGTTKTGPTTTGPSADHPTGTPVGTPSTPTGPQGRHIGPTGGPLDTTKTGPTTTGPSADHPTGTPSTPTGPQGRHIGPTGGPLDTTKTGPTTTTTGPSAPTGPGSGHAVDSGTVRQLHTPPPPPPPPPAAPTGASPDTPQGTPPDSHPGRAAHKPPPAGDNANAPAPSDKTKEKDKQDTPPPTP